MYEAAAAAQTKFLSFQLSRESPMSLLLADLHNALQSSCGFVPACLCFFQEKRSALEASYALYLGF